MEPGIYRHYKGGMYNVLGMARHHDHGRLYAVYHPLEPHGVEGIQWNVRPVNKMLEIGGKTLMEWRSTFEQLNLPLDLRAKIANLLDHAFDGDAFNDRVAAGPEAQRFSLRFAVHNR
jgi:hypothetical protein